MKLRLLVLLVLLLPTVPALAQYFGGATWTQTTVTVGATDTVLIAANPIRRALCVWNPTGPAVYLGYGVAAVSGVGVSYGSTGVALGRCWASADSIPVQAIHGIVASGTASVVIEESH